MVWGLHRDKRIIYPVRGGNFPSTTHEAYSVSAVFPSQLPARSATFAKLTQSVLERIPPRRNDKGMSVTHHPFTLGAY